ncbi:B12-binding domain-containing radical SAM protein [Pseudonocardia phyllosphaerae]|uniref:B12-binding domain-containing radical SAM protein n=1 Tax=Pseudonocardia phyllosphaerae TaxID=3390502 RepID=UPI00397A824D
MPSYFNAGHHLPTFVIAEHLRNNGHDVIAVDGGALNLTWKEFADLIFQGQHDAVVIVNEYDVVEGVRRAVDYCRMLNPKAVLVTAGRLSQQNPDFFRRWELDAVVTRGDYEAGVATALEWFELARPKTDGLPGVLLNTGDGWQAPSGPGTWLPPEEWALPNPIEIPYDAYEALYRDDRNRFCGIPERRELVVPAARGCPVGCEFCDVPPMQGLRERRLAVDRTLDYIRTSFENFPFEYVAFYAPTFTLDRKWVRDFCLAIRAEPRRYPWKCTTTLHHLNKSMVQDMASAGCIRISVGVETFEESGAEALPRVKQSAESRFVEVVAWCNDVGIELNCFVIVGLPGTSPDGALRTMDTVRAYSARARPTLYTPYHHMHADMSERELSSFNRQTFVDVDEVRANGFSPTDFLALIFGGDQYVTPATTQVPRAHSH